MKIEDLLHGIEPQWRESFVHFVQTGEAQNEFLDYVNLNEVAQRAIEAAFDAQAQAFEAIAEELKAPRRPADECISECALDVSAKAAHAVEDVMLLSPEESREAMRKTASVLKVSLAPAQKELLLETLMDTLGGRASDRSSLMTSE
jgi:hypothetical protein